MSQTEKHEFQAEIKQLLDIVIHSLYTDKEIFLRELVSNAADACEKFRFRKTSGEDVFQPDVEPSIQIEVSEEAGTVTITDTGIGMSREEIIENLGTIAHSGSKAFLKALQNRQEGGAEASLIGQFGVGFYSAFMVASEVQVTSRSASPDAQAWTWTCDGSGSYQMAPAEGEAARGTRIVVTLKEEEKSEFTSKDTVSRILKRYSNFVPFPIELENERLNKVQAIWTRSRNEITEDEYKEFYHYIGHDSGDPKYRLHFNADAPLSIKALLFVPSHNLESLGMSRSESEVHLYCRKVLIQEKADKLFPEWLRFLRGVVDSEDLPLNISRESMQDSALMGKLNKVLTGRFLKFLQEQSEKEPEKYLEFYKEYQKFLKEGVVTDFAHKEALGKLLRYASSNDAEQLTSLQAYVDRMPEAQKDIYFILSGDRSTAEASPYLEALSKKGYEVLFLHDPWDEFVMEHLGTFAEKSLKAAEKADIELEDSEKGEGEPLTEEQTGELVTFLKDLLGERVADVKVSGRLVSSPAVAVDSDPYMTTSMRRMMQAMNKDAAPTRYNLEINPRHPVIKGLYHMKSSNADLAILASEHLLDSAKMAAGVVEDPKSLVHRMNSLLEKVLSTGQNQ